MKIILTLFTPPPRVSRVPSHNEIYNTIQTLFPLSYIEHVQHEAYVQKANIYVCYGGNRKQHTHTHTHTHIHAKATKWGHKHLTVKTGTS